MPAPPRLRRALALPLALALLVPACAGRPRAGGEGGRPAEVLVEVLPRSAAVSLDGHPLAPGGGMVAAPPAEGEHVLAVAAEGFEPVERRLPDADLAGTRVAEVLRPLGFAAGRALDYDDAEGLVLAAAFLARGGRAAAAVDYAERAVALAPTEPEPRRVLGDAAAGAGDLSRAAGAWAEYLRLAPGAPDAAEIAARRDEARGEAGR